MKNRTDGMIPKAGESRYTVVVEYPNRLQNEDRHCPVTYVCWCCALSWSAAKEIARKEAHSSQPPEKRGAQVDWLVLLVFNGHHDILLQA